MQLVIPALTPKWFQLNCRWSYCMDELLHPMYLWGVISYPCPKLDADLDKLCR